MAGNPFAADFSTKSDITTAGALMMSALQERAKALDFSKVGEGIQTMLNPFEELENKAQDIRATQTAELINRLSPDTVEDMYKQGFNLAGFLAEQGIDPNNQAISNAWAGQQATRVQRGKQKLQDEIKQAYELSGKSMAPAEFLQRYRAEHPDIPAEYYPFNADFLGSIDQSSALKNTLRDQFYSGSGFEAFADANDETKKAFTSMAAEELAPKFRQEFNKELQVLNDANQTEEKIMLARQYALNKYRQMLRASKIDPNSNLGKMHIDAFTQFLDHNIQSTAGAKAANKANIEAKLYETYTWLDENASELNTFYDDTFKSDMKAKKLSLYKTAINGTAGWANLNDAAKVRLAAYLEDQINPTREDEVSLDTIKTTLKDMTSKELPKWKMISKYHSYKHQKAAHTAEEVAQSLSNNKEKE